MNFKINELDAQKFNSETHLDAKEHPHTYFHWMQASLLGQVLEELKEIKTSLAEKEKLS